MKTFCDKTDCRAISQNIYANKTSRQIQGDNVIMSMLDSISAQLFSIGQKLQKAIDNTAVDSVPLHLDHAEETVAPQASDNGTPHVSSIQRLSSKGDKGLIVESIHNLYQNINRINILAEITRDLKGKHQLSEVVDATLDAVWKRSFLQYVVLILGKTDLGPYYYAGMRGTPNPWTYLLRECPFPLSGVLAETILRRRMPDEPDYVYLENLQESDRLSPAEFPWLPRDGSLLMVPLRCGGQAVGALMLGSETVDAFSDVNRCTDIYDIASISAEAVQQAQMHQEVNTNAEKLVNVQLITRELAMADSFEQLDEILTHVLPDVSGKITAQLYLHDNFQYLDAERNACLSGREISHAEDEMQNTPVQLHLSSLGQAQDVSNEASKVIELLNWSVNAGQPLFYNVDSLDGETKNHLYEDVGSAAIVPVIEKQNVYGVIHVVSCNRHSYLDESDMVILRTIANAAALSLAKIQALQEKNAAQLCAAQSLVELVESRHPILQGHSVRTAHNVMLFAQELGFNESACNRIRVTASLHDIGLTHQPFAARETNTHGQHKSVPVTTAESIRATHHILNGMGFCKSVTDLIAELAAYKEHLVALALESTGCAVGQKENRAVPNKVLQDPIQRDVWLFSAQFIQPPSMQRPSAARNLQSFTQETQTIALVDTLDTFLLLTSVHDDSPQRIALMFLEQMKIYFPTPRLVDYYQSLLKQELVLLPQS